MQFSRLAGLAMRSSVAGRLVVVVAGAILLSACVADGRVATPVAPPVPQVETANVATAEGAISGNANIDRLIETYAARNDVPSALAYAVIRVESRYNPKARGRGVYGLSQIMPSTARSLGFSGSANDLFDPETNLKYGMKYLAGAWEKGGHDVCRASMKYKAGHRATRMSRSTLAYCSAVKRHMAEFERRRMPSVLRAEAAPAVPVPETKTKPAEAASASTLVSVTSGEDPVKEPVTAAAKVEAEPSPAAPHAAQGIETAAAPSAPVSDGGEKR